ncbi:MULTISPECIES: replicative DNA helicase [Aurantimonas]|uniref:replicative DNA helicase n=1 Tax=Aurantimonas TaxID=182269 RepID=UPI0035186967
MSDRRRQEVVPQSDSAPQHERAIIAYCLTNPHEFFEVSGKLDPSHFFVTRHARIWDAMQKVAANGQTPNKAQVRLRIDPSDRKEDTALEMFLGALIHELQNNMEGFDFAAYVDTVVTLGQRRQMIDSLQATIVKIRGMDPSVRNEDVVDEAVRSITSVGGNAFDRDMRTYGEFADDVAQRVSAMVDDEDTGGYGLSPGLKGVEEVMGPLIGGKVYVLAGMSSGGKSALAKSIMEAAALDAKRKGLGYIYNASLEMNGQEHAARSLADFLGIPSFKIERAAVNRGEAEMIATRGREKLHSYPIMIDQRRRMTMEVIRARMMKLKHQRGLAMGVIDHLLLIRGGKKDSLMDRVMDAVIEAKIMAGEFNIPILLLSQINEKNLLDRPSGWPIASDLFGGASIVQNADIVMFVHRPELVLRKKEPAKAAVEKHDKWIADMDRERGRAWVFTDKSRGMEGGLKRQLRFDGETMRFSDAD